MSPTAESQQELKYYGQPTISGVLSDVVVSAVAHMHAMS